MKRITVIILCILCVCLAASCAYAGETADTRSPWIPAEDPSVTEELGRMIGDALNGLVGVEYLPIVYLGSCEEELATLHVVLCQARVVVPGAKFRYVVLCIAEDPQDGAELRKMVDLDIETLLAGDGIR